MIARSGKNNTRPRADGHDQPWHNLHIAASSSSHRADKIVREPTARPANGQPDVGRADSSAAGAKFRGGQLDQIPIV